jgi:glycosyltransferase involved in cell wall biosynthesis
MPKALSILMPVHNEERYICAALASLKQQSFSDWELIVVDDGSTDDTLKLLTSSAETDPRIKIITIPKSGLVMALNRGLAECSSQFVARMDGDDISHPRRLEEQLRFLQAHPEIDLVASAFRHFPRQHLKIGMIAYESWQNSLQTHDDIIRDLYVESPFVHPSVMFRKEVVIRVGGYRRMPWAEDYDLWLRMASDGSRFARVPRPLFFWRERPERATRTLPEYTAAAFRACKAHHLAQGFLLGERSVILAGAGKEGRAWRKAMADVGIAVCGWIDADPRKIGGVLHGVPVMGPDEILPGDAKMLVTVGTRGAREGLRHWADGLGFVEGVNYLCVT